MRLPRRSKLNEEIIQSSCSDYYLAADNGTWKELERERWLNFVLFYNPKYRLNEISITINII